MLLLKQLALAAALLTPALANVVEVEEENSTEIESRALQCVHNGVHIIAAPGEMTTKGDEGYLQSLINLVKNGIGGDTAVHQIVYPEGSSGPNDIAIATPAIHKHIRAYAKKCPKTKMVLLSYSVGAAATMDVLCGAVSTGDDSLKSHYIKNILGIILYGDLTAVTGLSYDEGTCTSSDGRVPRVYPGKCFPFGKKIHSYCDEGDPQCCGNGYDGDPAIHFSYPAKYDTAASNYIINRWKRYKARSS